MLRQRQHTTECAEHRRVRGAIAQGVRNLDKAIFESTGSFQNVWVSWPSPSLTIDFNLPKS